MKILPQDFFNLGRRMRTISKTKTVGFRLNKHSSFILPPSSLLFTPQVRKPLGRVSFSSHCVGQEKLKMIRLNTRKNTRDKSHEGETNFRRFLARAIAVSALSLLLSVLSFGQSSTSITGEIADENGGKVSGADVRLRSRSGVQLSTATASNGAFEFRDLPSGHYLIEVQADGFATFVSY